MPHEEEDPRVVPKGKKRRAFSYNKNRRTDERTEYKKRSFKEKQAVKSIALEFMQNGSAQ